MSCPGCVTWLRARRNSWPTTIMCRLAPAFPALEEVHQNTLYDSAKSAIIWSALIKKFRLDHRMSETENLAASAYVVFKF